VIAVFGWRLAAWQTALACILALAAAPSHAMGQSHDPIVANGCVRGTNYETEGFRIRSAKVRSPFAFLRTLSGLRREGDRLAAPLEGAAFRYDSVKAVRNAIENLNWLPDLPDLRVRASVVVTSVENCEDRALDVVFSVYSTQVASFPRLGFESRRTEKVTPQATAGLDRSPGGIRLVPRATYDGSDKLRAGGTVSFVPRNSPLKGVDSLAVGGLLGDGAHTLGAAAAGEHQFDRGFLARAEWQGAYRDVETSASGTSLHDASGALGAVTTTRPFAGMVPLRFGAMLDVGHSSRDSTAVDTGEVRGSHRSVRLTAGASARGHRNTISASLGVELGGGEAGADWTKAVVDVAHEVSWLVRDHHSLDVTSRIGLGRLRTSGVVPVGTYFVGGSRELYFSRSADWDIRANPVVRSIPANDFTLSGGGATGFVAYNLTLSYPVIARPLVPRELSADKEFTEILNGQLASATTTLAASLKSDDPHFTNIIALLRELQPTLDSLKGIAARAQESAPDGSTPALKRCASKINTVSRNIANAIKKPDRAVGTVVLLVPEAVDSNGEDQLNAMLELCTAGAAPPLSGPIVDALAARLRSASDTISSEYQQIDVARATRTAEAEIAPAKRIVNTLIYEANILSVGPVAMFDAARLSDGGRHATGIGIGGGIRAIVASSFSVTVAYVANPRRDDWPHAGAFLLSREFRDVFN
jgi:hypothetical protein